VDTETLIAVVAIVVSGVVGLAGVLLNYLKRTDMTIVDKASRRTTALQMLSDEELTLQKVREECRSFQLLIEAHKDKLGDAYSALERVAERTNRESKELIRHVREKRKRTEPKIRTLAAHEIEDIIAQAYQGKLQAEAQLYRSQLSKADTLSVYLPELSSRKS